MTTPAKPIPVPIDWRNLIHAGRDLLDAQPGGNLPTDEHVRRAISNAYYALFHALAASNASALIGSTSDATAIAAWSRVYRGLDHATARRELERHRQEFSAPAQRFASTFGVMQELRHSADYDPAAGFTVHEAVVYLDRVEAAILDFTQVPWSEQVYIATLTQIRPR